MLRDETASTLEWEWRYATRGLPSLGGQYADTAADAAAAQLARIALDRDTREAARDHTTASSDLASETLPVPRLSPHLALLI